MTGRTTEPGTIAVPGVGRVLVEPDHARVRLGVVIVRPTATAARRDAAEAMTATLAAIAAAGVGRPDVRTMLVGLDAVRDYPDGAAPRISGYQLTNAVEVTVRDPGLVGAVIDAALGAGATSLDGLEFRLADPTEAGTAARRAAMADARRRAATLATEAGVELGVVVGIVEDVGSRPGPWPASEMRMAASVETPVEAGTIEIRVDVVVSFAIR